MKLPFASGSRLFALIVLCCAFIAIILVDSTLMNDLDEQLKELWYKIHLDKRQGANIAVIEIDDKTLEKYFPEIPLPRDQIALLLNYLLVENGKPRVIGLDLYFEGPDKTDPANDTLLAYVMSQFKSRIVNAMFLPLAGSKDENREIADDTVLASFSYKLPDIYPPFAHIINIPAQIFLQSSENYGHIDVYQSINQFPKRLPAFVRVKNSTIGSFSIEIVRRYLDCDRTAVTYEEDGYLSLSDHRIPMDPEGTLNIRYFHNPEGYENYSMLNILEDLENNNLPKEIFEDKIVLVGVNSPVYYPKEITFMPDGKNRPNVYLHADIISNILNRYHVISLSIVTSVVLIIICGGLYILFQAINSKVFKLVLSFSLVITIIMLDFILFHSGFLLNASSLIIINIVLASYTGFRTFREQTILITEQEKQVLTLKEREESLIALEKELHVARAIQENLLPQSIPQIKDIEIFGLNIPASNVSGDFYDFIELEDGRIIVTLGDVSGKGISAAMLMAAAQAVIRTESNKLIDKYGDSGQMVAAVNNLIHACTDSRRFLTLFLAVLDPSRKTIEFVNAGHEPPLNITNSGESEFLEEGGLLIGAFQDIEYVAQNQNITPGQKLVIFSDGVSEAIAPDDEMYGNERLKKVVEENSNLPVDKLGKAIVADISLFSQSDKLSDDLTVIIIAVK
jgi:sigma-B regulation protein RsbU (phosphoserine phosphatase)